MYQVLHKVVFYRINKDLFNYKIFHELLKICKAGFETHSRWKSVRVCEPSTYTCTSGYLTTKPTNTFYVVSVFLTIF